MDAESNQLLESFDTVADPLAMLLPGTPNTGLFANPTLHAISQPWMNNGGDNYPLWDNWTEHAILRYQARMVVQSLAMSQTIAQNLRSYTIGPGFTYKFEQRDERNILQEQLARAVKRDVDQYFELNGWEQGEFETLVHDMAREDGEVFVAHFWAHGQVVSRIVPPEYIVDPAGNTRELDTRLGTAQFPTCWKYGVHVREGDRVNPLGYFAQWGASPADFSYFPARTPQPMNRLATGIMHHIKCNVPLQVKRGLSDFYTVGKQLVEDAKLVRNMVHGAAQQAAITWIEQYESIDASKIAEHVRARANNPEANVVVGASRPVGGSGMTQMFQKTLASGTALHIGKDKKYLPGPMGAERNSGFEIVASLSARRIGVRWCMPEYMISADASNSNYASTVVAESPFVKARERDQRVFAGHFREIIWKALQLQMAHDPGRYARYGIGSFADLRRSLFMHVQPPDVATRDQYQAAQANEILHGAGVLSAETWAARSGLDPEIEVSQGADMAGNPASVVQESAAKNTKRQLSLWGDYP